MATAIIINEDNSGYHAETAEIAEVDLIDENVTVEVDFSTLNYKDALVATHPPGRDLEHPPRR